MKFRLSIVMLVLVASSTAYAQGMPIKETGNFGIGIGAGTFATGVSMKYFLADDLSLQGNVGWWRSHIGCDSGCGFYRDALALSADLLLERGSLTGNKDATLDWQIGGGGGLGFDDDGDIGLAAAAVAGLQLNIHAIPIDFVLEYRPGLLLTPDFDLDLVNFTGHVRYYFKL